MHGTPAPARPIRAMSEPLTPADAIPADGPDVLTVDEAARFLRIGRNQLYDAIGRNEVPHLRVGRTIRLHRSALVRIMGADRAELPRR
jgi:excisionase family DNA binding protein